MATRRSSPCSSDEGGFPDPSAVRFTGPAGSGYTNTPADSEMNGTNPDGTKRLTGWSHSSLPSSTRRPAATAVKSLVLEAMGTVVFGVNGSFLP